MSLQYSPQQIDVLKHVESSDLSASIEAVAGSGKTTTIVESLPLTKGSVILLAFNKKIAQEIEGRVRADLRSRVTVSTFHAAGLTRVKAMWPRAKIDARSKSDRLIQGLKVPYILADAVKQLVSLGKQYGAGRLFQIEDSKYWSDLIEHFGLVDGIQENPVEMLIDYAQKGLAIAVKDASDVIDFDDMIWLPVSQDLPGKQYDTVFIDEAQDTNPARRALARMLLAPGGRVVAVGDRRQSIYAFSGANSNALDLLEEEFQTVSLPLTVSYRCPKAVVAHARRWVSHIESAPTAPEGIVDHAAIDSALANRLGPNDVILSRLNAPNAAMAFWLLRQGVACRVEGRDIGRGLLALTNKWKVNNVITFLDKLHEWCRDRTAQLVTAKKNTEAARIQDQVDTIDVIADGCSLMAELRDKINNMFADSDNDPKKILTLSSIHKAKGKEWDHVYWLNGIDPACPKWVKQAWEVEQEDNLCYVAATRAKKHLTLLPKFELEK